METFEAVIILNTNMSTKETKDKIKKYNDMLQDWCKTKKVKVEDMGVKKLAYPLKEIHTEGYYVLFTFMSHLAHIAELERQLRIDDQVLKFMVVKIEGIEGGEYELEDYHPKDEKSEQKEEKPNALDVLLGFADYNKRKEVS